MMLLITIMAILLTRTASLLPCHNLSSFRVLLSNGCRSRKYRFHWMRKSEDDGNAEEDPIQNGSSNLSSAYPPFSHSLQNNRLKHRMRNGLPLTGVVSGQYRDTDHVEILGLLGYDFLWADAEHSSASPDDIASMILAAERRGLPTLVRIGYGYQNIIGHVQKYLVSGAQGILLPQCESREDVEQIVKAVKFPPLGQRGLAGERWNAWGLAIASDDESDSTSSKYLSLSNCTATANQNSIVGVLIENQIGLDVLDEIMCVPGLDMIFLAPTDLSANMGLHGQIRHPKVLAKIEEAGEKIQRFNENHRDETDKIALGTLVLNADDYTYWRERKFNVLCGVAQNLFMDGAKDLLNNIYDYEERQKR